MEKYINIKRSWESITIKEYVQIKNIIDNNIIDEQEKLERIILSISDLTQNDINQLKVTEYTKLLKAINFIYKSPSEDKSINKNIRIGDKDFIIDLKLEDIVTGQYMALQNIMKAESSFNDKMKLAIGVFVRPFDKKWGDFDYDENVEYLYNNMSIVTALSIAAFFLGLQKRLMKHTHRYLNKEKNKSLKMMKKINNQK